MNLIRTTLLIISILYSSLGFTSDDLAMSEFKEKALLPLDKLLILEDRATLHYIHLTTLTQQAAEILD